MKRYSPYSTTGIILLLGVSVFAQDFRPLRPGIEQAKVIRAQKNAEGVEEPLVINLLRVDLSRVEVRIAHALDTAIGLETVTSLTMRHNAVAGVNAGFFATTGTLRGDNVGALVVGGRLFSEPANNRAAVGFIKRSDGTEIIFGHLKFTGKVEVSGGRSHTVHGVNRARGTDELVVYTSDFHRTTLTTPNGVEAVIRRGRITQILKQSGSNRIPEDGFIISATGSARDWALKNLRVDGRVRVKTELLPAEPSTAAKWQKACCVVGGGPRLVRDGRVDITNVLEGIRQNFVSDRHPRTAVARLRDGRLLLAVVDGRQPGYSVGVSLTQLADLLLEFGAVEAINLDGGGSTAMVVEGKLVNKPSDAAGERAVSDAILIFEKGVGGRK